MSGTTEPEMNINLEVKSFTIVFVYDTHVLKISLFDGCENIYKYI